MQDLTEFYENSDEMAQTDNTPQYYPSDDLENEGEAKTTYKIKSKKRCNDCESNDRQLVQLDVLVGIRMTWVSH